MGGTYGGGVLRGVGEAMFQGSESAGIAFIGCKL